MSPVTSGLRNLCLDQKKLSSSISQSSTESSPWFAWSPGPWPWNRSNSPKKSTPSSSVGSSSQDGGSKPSSRTSSSEYAAPVMKIPDAGEREPDVVEAEMDMSKVRYCKIKASIIPGGWSNDPKKLQPISINFPYESFGLGEPGPLLVSTTDDGDPRCLLWWGNRFYIWHTSSERLFYVTESFELRGILRRIKNGIVELQLQELQRLPRERFEPSGEYLQLSPEEIPKSWSNSFKDFDELRQMVDAQEFGLALPLPILAGPKYGPDHQLFQSGSRYYMFDQMSCDVFLVEEPVKLQSILHTLNSAPYQHQGHRGLKLQRMERLPEYGGPNKILDKDVPEGWTNKVDPNVVDYDWCRGWGLSMFPNTLLYSQSYLDGTPAYLFESQPSRRSANYLWKPSGDKVYRIDEDDGLPGILATLKKSSNKLKVALLEPLPGTESYRVADDEMPIGWMRVRHPDACKSMPWKKHGLGLPTPILQRTGPNGEIPEYLVESGKGLRPHYYLWNALSNNVHRVQAVMGLRSIFLVIDDPFEKLKLERLDLGISASWWQLLR